LTQDSPILSRLGITSPPIATGHCQYPGGDTGAERDLRGNPALVYRCSNVYGMDMVWIWYGYGYGSSFSYPTTVTNDCQHAKFDQVFGSKFVVSPKEPMDVCNQARHN